MSLPGSSSGVDALVKLLEAVSSGSISKATFADECVTFAGGASEFARDTLLALDGLKPLRLDVAIFFAQHALRQGWTVDRVLYVKARTLLGRAFVHCC